MHDAGGHGQQGGHLAQEQAAAAAGRRSIIGFLDPGGRS